jgi:hypothetical protein
MSDRKIIQISASALNDGNDVLYALCDDGTVWYTCDDKNWIQLAEIPQHNPFVPPQLRKV